MQVIKKMVLLLNSLNEEKNMGIVDLSRKTHLPTATVYRILTELSRYGLVEKDSETKKYSLGWKLLELSAGVLEREREHFYLSLFEPHLHSLAARFKDTAYLTVLKSNCAICIAKVEGGQNLRYYVQVGRVLPFHSSASAKVLLAFQPEPVKAEILNGIQLERYTPKTISTKKALVEHLMQVQREGYAVCDNELEIGAKAIAVPVYDASGRVFASIALVGPRERISEHFGSILSALEEAATEVTTQLREG